MSRAMLIALAAALAAVCAFVLSGASGGLAQPQALGRMARRLPWAASQARRANRMACLMQMPEMLDMLTLGLSAGLSFDTAVGMYCERSQEELSQALSAARLTWQMGIVTRQQALRKLADDLESPVFARFASSVAEALEFGTPLAATLEQQAEVLRDEQRSQVEEEIEKVPVKMLIPLGTLIVPAMLLAILGPLLSSALRIG